jgi:dynein intermediate chain 3, axonemal
MLTAGRWSPTRPGVLVIGRSDGILDVWDLLDTSTKPTLTAQLFSSAIASLEFRSPQPGSGGSGGKQLLAVGDDKGSVHLLDFPLSLRRGVPNEEALVSAYLGREASRAVYVQVW